jgi:hypothetical protein
MSFILRSHRDRHRQRERQDFYRGLMVVGSILIAILIGYVGGQKKHEQQIRQLTEQNKELKESTSQSEQMATKVQADLQTQITKYQQLETQYKRDVPQGDLGLITALVKEQIDKGFASDRMIQIIRAAQPPQNCSQTVSKRLIVTTPTYKGPDSAVTFADGTITVKGSGVSSINNNQEKEALFDPGKPVTINFSMVGGLKESKTGLLPLHYTIILRNKEYRFTIAEGPRSFIVISGDNCDYTESVINSAVPYSKPKTDN